MKLSLMAAYPIQVSENTADRGCVVEVIVISFLIFAGSSAYTYDLFEDIFTWLLLAIKMSVFRYRY